MTKTAKIQSVQIIPVQGMKAYCMNTATGDADSWDVIAIRVTIFEDGHTAWYPVHMEHLVSESILDARNIDIYWDWIEYNGTQYGDYPQFANPFPDKVV